MVYEVFRKFNYIFICIICTSCFEFNQAGNHSYIPKNQPNLEKAKKVQPLKIDARIENKFVVHGNLHDSSNTYLYFLANGESLIASGRASAFIAQGEVVLPSRVGIKNILVREIKGEKRVETFVKGSGSLIKYKLRL